mgnify:FL=1
MNIRKIKEKYRTKRAELRKKYKSGEITKKVYQSRLRRNQRAEMFACCEYVVEGGC